jgi:archaellum component FlaF (FlaF/FlaG flagellin family)
MHINSTKLKYFISLLVIFGLVFACKSKKDETTEKKEDTKKEETKKEETKKEETRSESTAGNSLYFVEEYRNGQEIGKSDVFTIPSGGGYLTVMIRLDKPIGVGKVDLRISRKTGGSEKIVETLPFDVQPDWDYIHFDEITFRQAGTHKVTALKPDGSPVASGEVEIKYR